MRAPVHHPSGRSRRRGGGRALAQAARVPGRRRAVLPAVLAVVLALTGCSGVPPQPSDPYVGAALAYGQAPSAGQGTTFGPDVVIVGGGGESVRSVTADGLTWTLDAGAPGADKLAVGSVLFVTGRGVGRVLALDHVPGGLAVTLGPVELTDVIRDGKFASDGPIELDRVVVQSSPDAFWADPDVASGAGIDTAPAEPAGFRPGGPRPPRSAVLLRAAAGLPPRGTLPTATLGTVATAQTGAFALTSTCCSTGVGTKFTYDKGGLRIAGQVKLSLGKPSAKFNLAISGGTVTSAEFRLNGDATLHADIEAATAAGRSVNGYSPPLGMNIDFAVPVGTLLGVPFSLTVHQLLNLRAFLPGTAEVKGVGDYRLSGGLGFSYGSGGLRSATGASFSADTSLAGTNSLAVGISGVTVDYTVEFTIGIGMFGFTAGLRFSLTGVATLTVGAPIGFNVGQGAEDPIEKCKSAQAGFWVGYGIGYSIPKPVADLVNWFLAQFDTTPIQASGGVAAHTNVLNTLVVHPDVPICRKS